jgi:hypothetical protein
MILMATVTVAGWTVTVSKSHLTTHPIEIDDDISEKNLPLFGNKTSIFFVHYFL